MDKTLCLDLPLLLPDVQDARDACVRRLTDSLESREGVKFAHIRDAEDEGHTELCIHYDPAVLSLERIRQLAETFGAEIAAKYEHVVWQVDGISHQRRARTVSARVRRLPGIIEAEVNVNGTLRIEFDRTQTNENDIRNVLADMRVSLERVKPSTSTRENAGEAHDHDHAHGGIFGAQTELIFVALCGVLLLLGWLLPKFVVMPSWGPLFVLVPAYFFGGYYALREAIDSVRNGRFEIDFLMLLAAAGGSGRCRHHRSQARPGPAPSPANMPSSPGDQSRPSPP